MTVFTCWPARSPIALGFGDFFPGVTICLMGAPSDALHDGEMVALAGGYFRSDRRSVGHAGINRRGATISTTRQRSISSR